MISPTVILGAVSALLLATGISIYAIDGAVTLKSAGLLWIGLMIALFLLYARFGEIKRLLAKKGARYGANMAVMVTIFALTLASMAALGQAHKKRIDLTSSSRFTLSTQTKKIVRALDTTVKAVAFYRSESGTLHAKQRQMARDLLEEYAGLSGKFTFTFIDPDRKPGLASRYGVSEYRIILLMAGGKQVKVGAELEEKLTNGLIKLLRKKQKYIYFVKGHGEKSLASNSPPTFTCSHFRHKQKK